MALDPPAVKADVAQNIHGEAIQNKEQFFYRIVAARVVLAKILENGLTPTTAR